LNSAARPTSGEANPSKPRTLPGTALADMLKAKA
jgi:hypothetical protein